MQATDPFGIFSGRPRLVATCELSMTSNTCIKATLGGLTFYCGAPCKVYNRPGFNVEIAERAMFMKSQRVADDIRSDAASSKTKLCFGGEVLMGSAVRFEFQTNLHMELNMPPEIQCNHFDTGDMLVVGFTCSTSDPQTACVQTRVQERMDMLMQGA